MKLQDEGISWRAEVEFRSTKFIYTMIVQDEVINRKHKQKLLQKKHKLEDQECDTR